MSDVPFSFTNSRVLLLPVAEACIGLLPLVSSDSVPFNMASAAGEEASLAATSLSPSMKKKNPKQINKVNYSHRPFSQNKCF